MLNSRPDCLCPVMPVLPESRCLPVQHSSLPVRSPGLSAAAGDPHACRAGPLLFPLLFQLQPLSLTRQAQEYLKSWRCCCCTGLAAPVLLSTNCCRKRCRAFIPTRAKVYLTTNGIFGACVNNQPVASMIISPQGICCCAGSLLLAFSIRLSCPLCAAPSLGSPLPGLLAP